jgi:hypothetical protein
MSFKIIQNNIAQTYVITREWRFAETIKRIRHAQKIPVVKRDWQRRLGRLLGVKIRTNLKIRECDGVRIDSCGLR